MIALDYRHGTLDICGLKIGLPGAHLGEVRAIDIRAHGIEVTGKRLLGKGAFNDVHACLLKGPDGGLAHEIAIKKIQSQLFCGRATTVQAGVGIDHFEPRLAQRNIATSLLDGMLGTAIVPRASAVSIDDQSYLAMTIAPGASAKSHYREDPTIIFEPDFQRKCSDVEVLAYLSGHPDVHSDNIMISAIKRGSAYADIRVSMIDNDFTFGQNVDNPDQMPGMAGTNQKQYRHTGLPAYIDINTASRIRSMQRPDVSNALRAFLTDPELKAFEARFDLALSHVDYLKRINRVVCDWRRFVNARYESLDGRGFFEGTLDFSGIMQGSMGEARYFCPRSLILRDCLEGRVGGIADLDALIGRKRRLLLHAWSRSVKKHVPPSGIDHR